MNTEIQGRSGYENVIESGHKSGKSACEVRQRNQGELGYGAAEELDLLLFPDLTPATQLVLVYQVLTENIEKMENVSKKNTTEESKSFRPTSCLILPDVCPLACDQQIHISRLPNVLELS